MSLKYIYEHKNWPELIWHQSDLLPLLEGIRLKQGQLIGKMEALGFSIKTEALLQTLTEDVLKTSEIEGEKLDRNQIRSSIARRLKLDIGGLVESNRHVDGVVEMLLDATQKFDQLLTEDRIFGWHAALFPTGRSGISKITVGDWRTDSQGPMQVISGAVGKEKIHFQAPQAKKLKAEMKAFLKWFNATVVEDSLIRAGLAHFWFITLHPFDDGNGRIARAVADMCLARSEKSSRRFYSMSSQINLEGKVYYNVLEKSQKGSLDITPWLLWFLSCLDRAIENAEVTLASVLQKSKFWDRHRNVELNERQKKVLNRLIDGFEGKLTSSKWATITKCSQDTASRDIQDLINKKIIVKDPGGGRSTSYSLALKFVKRPKDDD